MHGFAKATQSPLDVLGLESDFTFDSLHTAYRLCRQQFDDFTNGTGPAIEFNEEEIENAYRDLLSLLEEKNATLDEDNIVSAALMPGLSSAALQAIGSNENVVYLSRRNSNSAPNHLVEENINTPQSKGRPDPRDKTTFRNRQPENFSSAPANPFESLSSATRNTTFEPASQSSIINHSAHGRRLKTLAGAGEKEIVPVRSQTARTEESAAKLRNILENCQQISGGLLKNLREEVSVGLEELSTRTKISRYHLEALESDNAQALPAIVYFRGFIVAYLRYLGIERDDVTNALTEHFKSKKRLNNR